MHDTSTFLSYVQKHIDTKSLLRITFTQSAHSEMHKILCTPVYTKNIMKIVQKHHTKDTTSSLTPEQFIEFLNTHISGNFKTVIAHSINTQCHLVYNKKGKIRIYHKTIPAPATMNISEQKTKKQYIDFSHPIWQNLHLAHGKGDFSHKKQIQISHFLRYLEDEIETPSDIVSILDCGCGKGYLTTALALSYPHASVIGIDTKSELMNQMNSISTKHSLHNISYEDSAISSYPVTHFSVIVALHACNTATDDAIKYGVYAKAQYIVCSPCCHQELHNQISSKRNNIHAILRYGIQKDRYAEMVTDTLRALYLEKHGYKVKIIDFVSTGHSGKNILMIATKRKIALSKQRLQEIDEIISSLLESYSITYFSLLSDK